ncbi:MAG: ThiF family adenylyltransferase [Leptospiraceae bacterium]|nr:ThiF family adenylyltransferase [Leptospiraceae bacterium]MCB1202319.1 ThiF family adenylyltransferase [Leptospiraceae bacterium]
MPPSRKFSKTEIERYSRQILLYGLTAQERLAHCRVGVIGAGGIGAGAIPALAAAGFGEILIFDDDRVENSNLGRQTLFRENQKGESKAEIACNRVREINPYIECTAQKYRITPENIHESLHNCSLILEGSDSIDTKFLISDFSVKNNIAAIIGAIGPEQGHIFPILPSAQEHPSACYRCIFENPPEPGEIPDCATAGVLSALPALIGAQMAFLASLLVIEQKLQPLLWLMQKDGWRTISLRKNPDCGFCSIG